MIRISLALCERILSAEESIDIEVGLYLALTLCVTFAAVGHTEIVGIGMTDVVVCFFKDGFITLMCFF
jgi:hypothetical protein